MRIKHIFCKIDSANKKDLYIENCCFSIEYISKIIDNDKDTLIKCECKEVSEDNRDYNKLYHLGLCGVNDDTYFSEYDTQRLNDIDTTDGNLLLINGDFNGIQRYIFDNVHAKRAAKILRSRSAMVQLITYAIMDILITQIQAKKILFGAGKFLLIAQDNEENKRKIDEIQKEIDEYFYTQYFGESAFFISYESTTKALLQDANIDGKDHNLENLLSRLYKQSENKKFQKFNNIPFEPFDVTKLAKSDDDKCGYCFIRFGIDRNDKQIDTKCCDKCYSEIKLGQRLAQTKSHNLKYLSINKHFGINILNTKNYKYYVNFHKKLKKGYFDISGNQYDGKSDKWTLRSYASITEQEQENKQEVVKSFEELCENSSGLMAIKADVDNLGSTFKSFYNNSFRNHIRLSREMDLFFSDYAISLLKDCKNMYVIFSGGDDIFLVGEYKEAMEYISQLRDYFYKFSLGQTISVGCVMFKPTIPIRYISDECDSAEKRAKANDKDSIDIFGISMKFNEFCFCEKYIENFMNELDKGAYTSTLMYRLIEICNMSYNTKTQNFDVKDFLWKSKLSYLFERNVRCKMDKEKYEALLKDLEAMIDKYNKKLIPSINLVIYKKRDEEKQ